MAPTWEMIRALAQIPLVLHASFKPYKHLEPSVTLGKTTLMGKRNIQGDQDFFGGIPYAEPPVGGLRFRPPEAKLFLPDGTFRATDYGPICVQDLTWLGNRTSPVPISEDCLSINIQRPSDATPSSKLPVMFWIHGGALQNGGAPFYNGTGLVKQSIQRGTPVIYVNINYRLGALGFPVGDEAATQGVLNLGLKDQKLALQWVQHHIEAFGGDKTKVMVFGESAGSISTSILMLDPSFAELARGAILESGLAASGGILPPNMAARNSGWREFVANSKDCSFFAGTQQTLSCLRRIKDGSLLLEPWMSAMSTYPSLWNPALDGNTMDTMIPDLPSRIYESGEFARIPFIVGSVLDEATLFISHTNKYTSQEIRSLLLTSLAPSNIPEPTLERIASKILQLYPDDPSLGCPFGTGNDTFGLSPGYKRYAAMYGDIGLQGLRRASNKIAASSGIPSWSYIFTDPQSIPAYGVNHASEVAYIFSAFSIPGNIDLSTPRNLTAALELSAVMIDYWISFAVDLDPNDGRGKSRPTWEDYGESSQLMQLQGNNVKNIPDTFREEQLAFIIDNALAFSH